MGNPKPHPPVKLFVGMISGQESLFRAAKKELEKEFGPRDLESDILPWRFTQYYEEELGPNLLRQFISFARLIEPERLARIKIFTNQLEVRLSESVRRRINLDPGYLDAGKLVLATTKDHAHRVYIGECTFAEVTLSFRGKTFRPWEWTYPDYATPEYITIFNGMRKIYLRQLKGT